MSVIKYVILVSTSFLSLIEICILVSSDSISSTIIADSSLSPSGIFSKSATILGTLLSISNCQPSTMTKLSSTSIF